MKTLKNLYTTGCNIPIFVAGFAQEQIKAIKTNSDEYSFQWDNFYDPDDALGWPLQPLSDSYKNAVAEDHAIDASGSLFGAITSGWNPLSHNKYWEDSEVIDPLMEKIKEVL